MSKSSKSSKSDRAVQDIVEVGRIVVDASGAATMVEADPLRFGESVSPAHAEAWKSARLDATRAASHAEQAEAAAVRAACTFARAYGDGADLPRLVDESGEPLTRGQAWSVMHARPYRGGSDDSAASRAIAASRVVARDPDAASVGSIDALASIDRANRAAVKARTAAGEDAAAVRKSVNATERAALASCRKSSKSGAEAKRIVVARLDDKRGEQAAAADERKSEAAKSARAAASGVDAGATADVIARALGPNGAGPRGLAVAVAQRAEPEVVARFASALMEAAAEAAAARDAAADD